MRQLFTALAVILLIGCTPKLPYRTEVPSVSGNVQQHCAQAQANPGPAGQGSSSHQRLPYADLFFVEFDDQGLLYPSDGREFGRASRHIDALMAGLESLAKMGGLSIVVYVHGWKHNAQAADPDVERFRQLLADACLIEQAKAKEGGKQHRVVGVYVSWRGKSIDLPEPWISTSFWDRKNTAEHVAQGESRALFARLRAFQTAQNSVTSIGVPVRTAAEAAKLTFPEKKVLLILLGHSFGGLIIYNSVAQSLINSLYEAVPNPQGKKVIARFADMIIIANPAFEALRYTPLHRAAATSTFEEYQTPVFVSITSTADTATRLFFPLGRHFSTIFQTHASDEEREANRRTMGHIKSYITHDLELGGSACEGWKPPPENVKDMQENVEDIHRNLKLEIDNARGFFKTPPPAKWTRIFCGNTTLRHSAGHQYSPIWNVRTTGDLVPDHSDITGAAFVSFVRQLYHDVILEEIIKRKP
jgi:hypothetical protein